MIAVGRSWGDLGGGAAILNDDDLYEPTEVGAGVRLLRLWRTVSRALDDVRGAVREEGQRLARSTRSLTIRLCNPSAQQDEASKLRPARLEVLERDATLASATSIRWLVKHGLNLACKEAVGVAISTVVDVVEVARPKILEFVLPELLKALLLAMSGLEPSALNYLQLRMHDEDGGERIERIRLQLASVGPLAQAVSKCVDIVPRMDPATQKATISSLDSALRMSAGFATRAATADAASRLCSTCPSMFQNNGPASSNVTVRLLRAFYFASDRERGQAAKDKLIFAFGNIAALCPGSSVRSLAVKACEKCTQSMGNSDDPNTRRAAAAVIRSIAIRASNHLADGGPADIWNRRVLPVAFIGRKDSDPKVGLLWKEVWDEARGGFVGSAVSTSGFGVSLEENILLELVRECKRSLQDVSWERRVAGAKSLEELCDSGYLAPPPGTLVGYGNDVAAADRIRYRANATCIGLSALIQILVKPRFWIGKADVLRATARLASGWVEFCTISDISETPWMPLDIWSSSAGTDLIQGDNWFGDRMMESDEGDIDPTDPSDLPNMEIEVDDNAEDTLINFEECEKQLGIDNAEVLESRLDEETMKQDDLGEESRVTFAGLCRFFIEVALSTIQRSSKDDGMLALQSAALDGARALLERLPRLNTSALIKKPIYDLEASRLLGLVPPSQFPEPDGKVVAPLLVAGAISVVASFLWNDNEEDESTMANPTPQQLIRIMRQVCAGKQFAWTVREAAAHCISRLIMNCHASVLQQHSAVAGAIDCAQLALLDHRYWRVRLAGGETLLEITARVKDQHEHLNRRYLLDYFLPFKEEMMKILRSSLADSEPKVTALSSKAITNMSWWP
jgi:proteasome component ECM29